MLTLLGKRMGKSCDGINRRSFLQVGSLGLGAGAFSLADINRAEAARAAAGLSTSRHKSVINIFLGGGPPHQDMFDLKPDAPTEIRGEFKPIATNVPGIQIGECFPQIAARMDKCAIIRSMVGATGGHDAIQCLSGWNPSSLSVLGGRPSLGSVVSKVQGPLDPSVPPFVGLSDKTQHGPWSDAGTAGYLGSSYKPFKPDGQGMANLTLRGVNTKQIGDRRQLLTTIDNMKRDIDAGGQIAGADHLTERALGVLTSSKLVDALDLSKESDKVRARYGTGKPYQFQYDGAPTVNEHILMARRLIEAGVRVVTLSYGRWDSHGKNFDLVRDHGTKLDQALGALIDDLEVRGILQDVAVVVWGEFGRTPRINKDAGRDHWPQVSCALLFGGGMRTGQVIGSTNRLGEHAKDRPVEFGEVIGTLYHTMGLDPMNNTLMDPTGRPQHLVEQSAMRELV